MPQGGKKKGCSYYRGTCLGSVERRIRGIVPPNYDIVGHHNFGGLRYCKERTTFTTDQHYLTEEDIVQVGQSCLRQRKFFTSWDHTRQPFNRRTKRDELGLRCADPDNPKTCPLSRKCIDEALCPTDDPDWLNFDELLKHWGTNTLIAFADLPGEPDANGKTPPRTYETHKIILDPHCAYLFAKWPHASLEYQLAYTRVDWSLDGPEQMHFDGNNWVTARCIEPPPPSPAMPPANPQS